jgi:hypothetical protein
LGIDPPLPPKLPSETVGELFLYLDNEHLAIVLGFCLFVGVNVVCLSYAVIVSQRCPFRPTHLDLICDPRIDTHNYMQLSHSIPLSLIQSFGLDLVDIVIERVPGNAVATILLMVYGVDYISGLAPSYSDASFLCSFNDILFAPDSSGYVLST